MNKTLIFLCFSTAILVLSIVVVCISPILNNIKIESQGNWSFSSWRTLNCKLYEDQEKSDSVALDDIQKYKRLKTICKRKKAMHDLEYAALIINLILGFVCANFSLLHYLDVGKDFEKKTGIIGCVTGIIGFIITLVYVCFSGYIFDNDIAFSDGTRIKKLFPNGAEYKKEGSSFIHIYENDNGDDSEYAKFKDLGGKQYNYDSKYYKTFTSSSYTTNDCKYSPSEGIPLTSYSSCDYVYTEVYTSTENKDLYDRWLTTLILSIFIVACNVGLLIFGFLLFKSGADSSEGQAVQIV
jgi:hypothetical protein